MGILDRVSTLMRANINDLIDRAEDPEKVIRQLLADMQNQLVQVKTQVASSIGAQKLLHKSYLDNQAKATEWERKAELAVERGQDDLAREALQRRNAFQASADGFREQHEEQAKQVESLKAALSSLESKIAEAQAKKDLLIARSRRAKAEVAIRSTLNSMDPSSAMAGFERMEEKVAMQEARAAALGEMETDTLDQRFAMLEDESEVDQQLAAMKAKKGLAAGGGKALGSGAADVPTP